MPQGEILSRFWLNLALYTALIGAGLLGAGVSAYLYLISQAGLADACGLGSCAEVLNSPLASPFGVSLAAIGLGVHLALLFLSLGWLSDGPSQQRLLTVGGLFTAIATLFSVALPSYAVLVLRAPCLGCLNSGFAFASALGVYGIVSSLGSVPRIPRRFLAATAIAGLMLTGFIVTAAVSRQIALAGTQLQAHQRTDENRLIPPDRAWWGRPDAPVEVLAWINHDCGWCRVRMGQLRPDVDAGRTRVLIRHASLKDSVSGTDWAVAYEGSILGNSSDAFLRETLSRDPKLGNPPDEWKVWMDRLSPKTLAQAQQRVVGDRALARELGVSSVPFLVARPRGGTWRRER